MFTLEYDTDTLANCNSLDGIITSYRKSSFLGNPQVHPFVSVMFLKFFQSTLRVELDSIRIFARWSKYKGRQVGKTEICAART